MRHAVGAAERFGGCRVLFLFIFFAGATTRASDEGLRQRVGMADPGERQPGGRAHEAARNQPIVQRLLGGPSTGIPWAS